jgi:hypothetical protein
MLRLQLPTWLRRRGRFRTGVYCVFRFPDSTESRWLEELPTPGTRVRSREGSRWVVDEVLQSGRETYTVHCVARRAYAKGLRERAADERDLAAELLEVARHTSESVTERRHRRRYRPFRT